MSNKQNDIFNEAVGETVLEGDCLEKLKELPENSVDSIVTDPPYELGFMGKSWDSTGVANNKQMWLECLRVLKPGGYLLSFGGTRTYHRMACAIEDAGFEIRDMIEWVYGSGFPKSLNIGKVTDKFLKTGNASWNGTGDSSNGALGYSKLQYKQDYRPEDYSNRHQNKDEITEEQAKQWEGWGTALKPAHEPICMARKPLAEKTVAENCLKYGTGGINIDESRVGFTDNKDIEVYDNNRRGMTERSKLNEGDRITEDKTYDGGWKKQNETPELPQGRFPANLIHDNSEEVRECFPDTGKSAGGRIGNKGSALNMMGQDYEAGDPGYGDSGNASRFFKAIENNDRMVWLGTPEEEEEYNNLIAEMQDDQVFTEEQDKRYEELSKKSLVNKYYKYPKINRKYYKSIIYQAKASKSERNKGCEGLEDKVFYEMDNDHGNLGHFMVKKAGGEMGDTQMRKNNHPTVKPIALMEYLIKMVTPKGGTVLDPFTGSGSTGVAAKQNGYGFIGIELNPEYIKIAQERINNTI